MSHSLHFPACISFLELLATGHSQAESGPSTLALSGLSATPGIVYTDSVYINSEVRPQFAGGDKAFMAYLSKFIRYPQQALQRHISGRVYVNFNLSA